MTIQANILVDDDLHIKLADFGLSVFADGSSRSYASMRGGNPRWLAPELIDPDEFGLDSQRPTFCSDVYSFACVLIEVCMSTFMQKRQTTNHTSLAVHLRDAIL